MAILETGPLGSFWPFPPKRAILVILASHLGTRAQGGSPGKKSTTFGLARISVIELDRIFHTQRTSFKPCSNSHAWGVLGGKLWFTGHSRGFFFLPPFMRAGLVASWLLGAEAVCCIIFFLSWIWPRGPLLPMWTHAHHGSGWEHTPGRGLVFGE